MKDCLEREIFCTLCNSKVKAKDQGTHRKECKISNCNKCGAEKIEKDHDCGIYWKKKYEEASQEYEEKINSEQNSKQALKS